MVATSAGIRTGPLAVSRFSQASRTRLWRTDEGMAKLNAVLDILKTKCVKRNVSLKGLTYGKVEEALGGTVRQTITIQSGLPDDKAKDITKSIKEAKFKAQGQIQGEQVRVQSKSKDELQAVMTHLKAKDFGLDLQFENYR